MRIWTEAAKAAQRAAIRRWQPWAKSTGPRSVAGKSRAAQNARKTATDHVSRRLITAALRHNRHYMALLKTYRAVAGTIFSAKRTIILAQLACDARAAHALFLRDISRWADHEYAKSHPREEPCAMAA